jgi:hypothetical protein
LPFSARQAIPAAPKASALYAISTALYVHNL